jgi:hypothetical protein
MDSKIKYDANKINTIWNTGKPLDGTSSEVCNFTKNNNPKSKIEDHLFELEIDKNIDQSAPWYCQICKKNYLYKFKEKHLESIGHHKKYVKKHLEELDD